jgi:chromosome partitioning protein
MATVALVSQKGGTGKSTLALALAWEMASRGGEALCVDADADRQGTLLEALGLAVARGMTTPTAVAMTAGMHQKEQLPRLARGYRYTIIDTPGRSDEVQVSALMVADVALIPVGQFAADVWAPADSGDGHHLPHRLGRKHRRGGWGGPVRSARPGRR